MRTRVIRLLKALGALGCGVLLAIGLPLPGLAVPRQKLRGDHVPAAVARLAPVGSLPGTQRLNLAIGLPLRNQQELDAFLHQLYDPGSPNYRRYLTPEQFTERFGPMQQSYQALIDFAASNGLTVTVTHPNRLVLDVEGTVADIQRIFHLTLRVYRHPEEAREFYAPDFEPSVDFGGAILHVSGLDNYSPPYPNLRIKPADASDGITPKDGSGPNGNYRGSDFRKAYVPGTKLTGAGQTVGLLQFDGFYPKDIATYARQAGLPSVPLTVVPVNGGATITVEGSLEVSMDIELVMSIAPGLSRIYVFEAPNPSPWVDLLNAMVTYTNIHQFSCSWCDSSPAGRTNPTAEQIFQQMAAQGQSFFNASGDYDAYVGSFRFPSDSPNITQVGGTRLATGSDGAYSSEAVWNWGGGSGSSGGISTFYPIPYYQQGISMVANQGSTTMRNVPDVALTADDVYVVYGNGSTATGVGGTSCAAPLWAGFTALVNQHAATIGLAPVGFLNPAMYAIGKGANYTTAFHDTTRGDNTYSKSPSRFFAVTGYDLCTGWGTPNGTNLINILNAQAPWIITHPQSQTVNAGDSVTFSVTARGMAPFNYQWFFNEQPISAATDYSYSIARVQSVQAGEYSVVVSNSYGSAQSAPATLSINSITALGVVGAPFLYQITADNSPSWYSASGLPSGLRCDGSSGIISGTPTRTGIFWVNLEARNIGGDTWSATILFTIADGAITSATSAKGVVGAPFSYQITADNAPTWRSASGLPPGLGYDGSSGLITGTPAGSGTFLVRVEARNIFGSALASIPFTITGGAITSSTNVAGVIGVPFSYQITADNAPTWCSASGLPAELHCSSPSGLISGIPTETGTFWFHVEAKNLFAAASALVHLTISDSTTTGDTASQPQLTISRTGDNVLLTWPLTSDGFVLEETPVQQNTWINSSAEVVTLGSSNAVFIPIQTTPKFYRLRR